MGKGSLTRDLLLKFFYESVSSGPLSILSGPFQIFMQIRVDIRKFVSHWLLHLNRRSLSGIAKPSLNVISGFRMQSHP